MRFLYALTLEYRSNESSGEAVAGADRVGHFYFRCGLERYVAWGEDIAAVDATSQNEHLQVVFSEKNPAFVLKVDAGITEHTANGDKFLIVYFQNIAASHRVT